MKFLKRSDTVFVLKDFAKIIFCSPLLVNCPLSLLVYCVFFPENIHTPLMEGFLFEPPTPLEIPVFCFILSFKIILALRPLPLEIANDPPGGGYGYSLE